MIHGGAPSDVGPLLQALGDYVFEVSPTGVYQRLLSSPSRLDPPQEAFLGRTVREVLPEDVAGAMLQAFGSVCRDGVPRELEYRLPSREGDRYFEARIAAAPSGNLFVVVRDVHTRRAAEERLRESEARFRLMADQAPVMLWKGGTDAECDFFNRVWLEFTGRSMDSEIGTGWAEGVHAEDFASCMDTYLAAFVARRPFRMEYRLRRWDGQYRWILDHGVPRVSPSGTFEGYVGSCIDITELKEAGDQIKTLYGTVEERLREREVLLREIHHRVKNNLQLISSLLGLSARQLDGPARQQVEEGQTRVRSIALIHEKLYDSDNVAHVDLTEYVRDLAHMVLHASGAHPEIRVRVEGERVRLAVDQACPCGLVINELLTNALKHAFPDGRSGSVRISVEKASGGRVALTVQDDGIGLPEHFDPGHPKTLGLDVVTTLAEQLDADLAIAPGPGAAFRLTFPLRGESP